MVGAESAVAWHRLVNRIDPGARLLRTWPLAGGVSAAVTAIEIARADGRTTKLVARRHGVVDLERNARIARHEFALLQVVRAHGVAAPAPVLVDDSGEPFPTPVLVVEYVEGETDLAPRDLATYVLRAAEELAKIHGVRDEAPLSFLPRQEDAIHERPVALDDALDEGRIRDALASAPPLARTNASVLLHGDYWPGNLLWRDGRLAAVIDWEDAAVGDPLADLANSRLEFLWAFGDEGMAGLTERYRALTGIDVTNLPYWDLRAALRPCGKLAGWGLDEATERRMRERHRWFVDRTLGVWLVR